MIKIFEPIELIEPLSLFAESSGLDDTPIVITCRNPGYLCKAGTRIVHE